jgi:hypothetical protein
MNNNGPRPGMIVVTGIHTGEHHGIALPAMIRTPGYIKSNGTPVRMCQVGKPGGIKLSGISPVRHQCFINYHILSEINHKKTVFR